MFRSQINCTFSTQKSRIWKYGSENFGQNSTDIILYLVKVCLLFQIWQNLLLGGLIALMEPTKFPWNPPLPEKKIQGCGFKLLIICSKKAKKKTWQKSRNAGLWGWSSVVAGGWLAGKIPCAHFPAQWTNPSPLPSPLPYPSPPYLASWNMIIIFAAAFIYRIYIIHGSHMKMLHEMYNFDKKLVESFAAVIM